MVVLVASAQVKPNADGAFADYFEQQLLPSLRVKGPSSRLRWLPRAWRPARAL
jgi:hypothetical protein